ncbi:MAG: hypothetical protein AAGC55_29940, partial [Myxococcota bacterium]
MDLLFAHDHGGPLVDSVADETAADGAQRVTEREATHLRDVSANVNDLDKQGWAVVAAEGAAG